MRSALQRLTELGQSPWYDNLTREHARGALRGLVDAGIRGVTSNPTIFEKAMASGTAYDDQISALATSSATTEEIFWTLVADDITGAADLLDDVYRTTDRRDGYVSVEVDPDLAHDTTSTVTQARELFERVGRPNVMIKIPATVAGLPAIEAAIEAGINVNVTLIFSQERYDQVIDAYMTGLERRLESGGSLEGIHSVASFFVSRVDTETDRRLPDGHPLRGTAAVANAKLAYAHATQRFASDRWAALAPAGANRQRPLWASTSTKNPAYSPTLYIDTLVGDGTINTLAQTSIDALDALDASQLRGDAVAEQLDEAAAAIAGLAEAGVDFADVTDTLEREGVAAFATSYHDALDTLAKKVSQLGG